MSLPAAFLSVVLIWSTTPLAIKWSVQGIDPSLAVFLRMAIGALLCLAILTVLRMPFPLHRRARLAYLAGGLSMFGAMALTYWSAQFVSSGMIAVLFGLSPLITSLGAALWLEEDAITTSKLLGMVLGISGLLLVFRGGLDLGDGAGLGLVTLFCAVVMQSLGLVWIKRIGDDSPPLAMTFGTLLVALPLFFTSWLITDGNIPTEWPQQALTATVYLGMLGSVLGFALYYYLIKHMDTGRVALITLITPVSALLLGHMLNDEVVLPQVWLGTACILFGLGLHHWGARWISVFSPRGDKF
jgi:drug/metabolite transporter (DMT)-like permease